MHKNTKKLLSFFISLFSIFMFIPTKVNASTVSLSLKVCDEQAQAVPEATIAIKQRDSPYTTLCTFTTRSNSIGNVFRIDVPSNTELRCQVEVLSTPANYVLTRIDNPYFEVHAHDNPEIIYSLPTKVIFKAASTVTFSARDLDNNQEISSQNVGTYEINAPFSLQAPDIEGYDFCSWADGSSNETFSGTALEGGMSVIAYYRKKNYNVTAGTNGHGTVLGGGTYNHGSLATVTATPNEHYSFVNWTENGTQVSTDQTYAFTVTADHNLVANFEGDPHTISAIANSTDGGTVLGDGTFNYGSSATLTATPKEHYSFVNWTENGTQVSTDQTYTFTVTADRNLVANFVPIYNVHITANPTTGGTVFGDGTYNYNSSATLTATPKEHYHFVNWTENGEEVSTAQTYTFTVTGNRELVANFELDTYTIKFVDEDGTELQSSEVAYGETPAYTGETPTKPNDDQYTYTFAGWSPEIYEVTGEATYTATYSAKDNTKHSKSEGDDDDVIPIYGDDKETLKSNDSSTQTEEAKTSEYSDSISTGDQINVSLWLILILASFMGLVIVLILDKKYRLKPKHYK